MDSNLLPKYIILLQFKYPILYILHKTKPKSIHQLSKNQKQKKRTKDIRDLLRPGNYVTLFLLRNFTIIVTLLLHTVHSFPPCSTKLLSPLSNSSMLKWEPFSEIYKPLKGKKSSFPSLFLFPKTVRLLLQNGNTTTLYAPFNTSKSPRIRTLHSPLI